MIMYFLIAASTCAIAFFIKNDGDYRGTRREGINTICLFLIFSILFLLSALRIEVGNDYGTYVDNFHEVYVGGHVVTEMGYNAVVKAIYTLLGGEVYLAVFAVFAFFTILLFLKVMYEQSESFGFVFFLFMTLGIYFRTFNTVRYYFVLAAVLYSIRYLMRKEYGKFIVCILFLSTFHKSVLVVLPLYFIATMRWKKWFICFLGIVGIASVLLKNVILEIALILYPSYRDTIYLQTESGIEGNLMTFIRCVVVAILCVICLKEVQKRKETLFYAKLNVLASMVYLFGSFLPLVGRFGYYLITPHMLLIPALLYQMEKGKKKTIITGVVIITCIVYFLLFLRSASEVGVRVLPYKSWLFYEKEFLNAESIF
ncbi:MAG: EpsG family protein [Lachnospiraceae bacterium]